jgi:hypothetical protein
MAVSSSGHSPAGSSSRPSIMSSKARTVDPGIDNGRSSSRAASSAIARSSASFSGVRVIFPILALAGPGSACTWAKNVRVQGRGCVRKVCTVTRPGDPDLDARDGRSWRRRSRGSGGQRIYNARRHVDGPAQDGAGGRTGVPRRGPWRLQRASGRPTKSVAAPHGSFGRSRASAVSTRASTWSTSW